MPNPSLPIDQSSEWYVLLRGERIGPVSREALRALLTTHPDGFQASVWRLGMVEWRVAASLSALTFEGSASEPSGVQSHEPSAGPRRVSSAPARDADGQLRVLSYGADEEPAREPSKIVAQPSPVAPKADAASEWDAVGTSELSAIGTSELRALGALELAPAGTNEWAAVGTSELRALGTSELRALAMNELSAQKTVSELRAVATHDLPRTSALASVIVSGETATELPSFNYRAERDALSPAPGAATPTPRTLLVSASAPAPVSRPPSRTPLFIVGALLVALAALALGIAWTLHWMQAAERSAREKRASPGAPLPPVPVAPPPAPVPAPPAPSLPAAEAPPSLDR